MNNQLDFQSKIRQLNNFNKEEKLCNMKLSEEICPQ